MFVFCVVEVVSQCSAWLGSMLYRYVAVFFFFKQKTAYGMRISDWSSYVCSSDLRLMLGDEDEAGAGRQAGQRRGRLRERAFDRPSLGQARLDLRAVARKSVV